jgi:hypothetical protein
MVEDISKIEEKIHEGQQISSEEFKLLMKDTDWGPLKRKIEADLAEIAYNHHLAKCRSYARGFSRYLR